MLYNSMPEDAVSLLIKIGKAIVKGAGPDMTTYLSDNQNLVNNAFYYVRSDKIITNIGKLSSDTVELKLFKRCGWTGCIILDRIHNTSYSVCAKSTLMQIPKNKDRRSPHYLQTLLNTENKELQASSKQMTMADYGFSVANQFSEEEYEEDFIKIMETALSMNDDYRHWVISYEAIRERVTGLSAILLDGEFGIVDQIDLLEMMELNFSSLTSDTKEEQEKDVRNLLSVKRGINGKNASEAEKRTEISPKTDGKRKEA